MNKNQATNVRISRDEIRYFAQSFIKNGKALVSICVMLKHPRLYRIVLKIYCKLCYFCLFLSHPSHQLLKEVNWELLSMEWIDAECQLLIGFCRSKSIYDVIVLRLQLFFGVLSHIFEVVVKINVKTIFPADYVYIFYHLSEVVEMTFFAYPDLHWVCLVIKIVEIGVLRESLELAA